MATMPQTSYQLRKRRRLILILVWCGLLIGTGAVLLRQPGVWRMVQRQAVLRSGWIVGCSRTPDGVIHTEQRSYSFLGCPVHEIGKVRMAIPGMSESYGEVRSGFSCPEVGVWRSQTGRCSLTRTQGEEGMRGQFYGFRFHLADSGDISFDGKTVNIQSGPFTCIIIDPETFRGEVHTR